MCGISSSKSSRSLSHLLMSSCFTATIDSELPQGDMWPICIRMRFVTVFRYNSCLCATVISVDLVLRVWLRNCRLYFTCVFVLFCILPVWSCGSSAFIKRICYVMLCYVNYIVLLLYPNGPAYSGPVSLVFHFQVLHFQSTRLDWSGLL